MAEHIACSGNCTHGDMWLQSSDEYLNHKLAILKVFRFTVHSFY